MAVSGASHASNSEYPSELDLPRMRSKTRDFQWRPISNFPLLSLSVYVPLVTRFPKSGIPTYLF